MVAMNRGIGAPMLMIAAWGCGAEPPAGDGGESVDDAVETGVLEQKLGLGCSNLSPSDYDAVMPNQWTATVTSPVTYSNPDCYRAWVVGLPNYNSQTNLTILPGQGCTGVPPAGQCSQLVVRAVLFKNGLQMADVTARGTEGDALCGCVKPEISWPKGTFSPEGTWYVGATVRRNWLPDKPTHVVRVISQEDPIPTPCYWCD